MARRDSQLERLYDAFAESVKVYLAEATYANIEAICKAKAAYDAECEVSSVFWDLGTMLEEVDNENRPPDAVRASGDGS